MSSTYKDFFEERKSKINKAIKGKLSIDFCENIDLKTIIEFLANHPASFYMHKNRHLLDDYVNTNKKLPDVHTDGQSSWKKTVNMETLDLFEGTANKGNSNIEYYSQLGQTPKTFNDVAGILKKKTELESIMQKMSNYQQSKVKE